ncbi:hypothetical protein BEWA_012580 [Theileria equi strain WA]|uniref:Uncharacterized protein n=1 Tax=Theileria equi strain WA TaxID=1537102 RepID=L1LBP9_THEEQ|nr:hypothetical protein BEWA_012580 [Theileria equi strain WA]EKX72699.1 hypothetical protein BEWA_012580 [Theileria equi strain WA]|eukprot:XP_004832151.1 hypothetical protein BEWA_012580 [Theileria equi strain WA]
MSASVDISKKCHGSCNCLWNNIGSIKANTDLVKGVTGYGYVTHSIHSGSRIKGLSYGGRSLEIEDGKRTTFSTKYHNLEKVTTYYYTKNGSNSDHIKIPLILRVYEGNAYHLYLNKGGDHTKWEKDNYSGPYTTPVRNNTTGYFTKKLKNLTCTLHHLHRVDILRGESGDPYYCQICDYAKITVKLESTVNGIYTRFDHTPTDNGEYYVTYGSNLVKYKGSTESKFKLLSVKKEVKFSGKSTWYENVGESGGKHDRWRKLDSTETSGFSSHGGDLKTKLDYLNCTLNNAVRIKLGRDSGCHDFRDTKHNNRISTRHDATISRQPFLSAYEYTNSKSGGGPFSVAEVLLQGTRQTFSDNAKFFENVKKLSSYASFCDTTKPFLICVEYSDNIKKWYQRQHEGQQNTWVESGDLSGKIVRIFGQVKTPLKISPCSSSSPPPAGIQIDIEKQPNDGTLDGTYVSSGSGTLSILMTKDYISPQKDFFKISHRPATDNETFVLNKQLQRGDSIGLGDRRNVKDVQVYFWQGEPDKPILLGINQGGNLKYYSKDFGTDRLTYMLDDQNCQRNNAIPFEIKNPTDPSNLSKLYKDDKAPTSIKDHKKITESIPPIISMGEYTAKEYTIKGDARISRVTFDGTYTNIGATKDTVTKVVVYYWKDERTVPLLVGFVKSDKSGSIFFENLGENPPYTRWKHIDGNESKDYYDKEVGRVPQPPLTDKLDQVSCRVHHTLKIDISKTDNEKNGYCHDRCSPKKRIKVINTNVSISGYTGYDHTSAIKAQKTFIVTAITKNDQKQDVSNDIVFPLREVSKITVYFQNCNGLPVAIKIEYELGKSVTWLKNEGKQRWVSFNPSDNELQNCQETQGSPSIKDQSTTSGDDSNESDEDQTSDTETRNYDELLVSFVSGLREVLRRAGEATATLIATSLPKPPQTPDTAISEPIEQKTDLKSNTTPRPAAPGSAEPIVGPGAAITTAGVLTGLGISSGTLAGAGSLTGLGWWAFKRSKGDPWVRQI